MKAKIKGIRIVGMFLWRIYTVAKSRFEAFGGSEAYWIQRYAVGENSGRGSYGKLAQFKAEVINQFVAENNVSSVLEYGCGDGNQLLFSNYPRYIGFDISNDAILRCRKLFSEDESKKFKLVDEYSGEIAELTLSLDVIYHLVEDDVYQDYMERLFDSSLKYVIIYSSNIYRPIWSQPSHIKHRRFSDWVDTYRLDWRIISHIRNRYPDRLGSPKGSAADFYIYQKT